MNVRRMLRIEKIKNKLRKKAVVFETGEVQLGTLPEQSWIGRVNVGYADEGRPLDLNQKPMLPLIQLCLTDIPLIPTALQNTKVLTVFISSDFLQQPKNNFCIREYCSLQNLVEKDFGDGFDGIKAFPLFPELIENDYPDWGSDDISRETLDIICQMEKEDGIEYYWDISERSESKHKIGGYADSCQGGVGFPSGYEFVFQVDSDVKAELNIGDGGRIFFAKNPENHQWWSTWDCY